MILIIGAIASGKRNYAKSLGYSDTDIAEAVLDSRPVLAGLETIVAADPDQASQLLPALLEKEVVICCEVGSGVIPGEWPQRNAREQTGRLCVLLAQKAERVIRMVCGIPTVLKDNSDSE